MKRSSEQLREDALAIWHAGVAAVQSDRLVRENVRVHNQQLVLGEEVIPLANLARIAVVGAGKAGAGMAAGLEQALGPELIQAKQVSGWINVPDDCLNVASTHAIHLHGARPGGMNEPTPAGVEGTREIVRILQSLGPNDLCICLLSGGGSALLPAPIPGITLADKQAITKFLSGAGANIQQLNTVRKQLSMIKGGGMWRVCGAGQLATLIISDVIGDPLDVIASGPTVPDSSTREDALRILEEFAAADAGIGEHVFRLLRSTPPLQPEPTNSAVNIVIGNNAAAVTAAGSEAERRGYSPRLTASLQLEGQAEHVGRELADEAFKILDDDQVDCLITGGEPVVQLVPAERRGKGGRNQQLVLAALERIQSQQQRLDGLCLLSGGTDGEDGPTDAAGAFVDQTVADQALQADLQPAEYLGRNDAYHFFAPMAALIKTGPTHTNVCDLRVVTTAPEGHRGRERP